MEKIKVDLQPSHQISHVCDCLYIGTVQSGSGTHKRAHWDGTTLHLGKPGDTFVVPSAELDKLQAYVSSENVGLLYDCSPEYFGFVLVKFVKFPKGFAASSKLTVNGVTVERRYNYNSKTAYYSESKSMLSVSEGSVVKLPGHVWRGLLEGMKKFWQVEDARTYCE